MFVPSGFFTRGSIADALILWGGSTFMLHPKRNMLGGSLKQDIRGSSQANLIYDGSASERGAYHQEPWISLEIDEVLIPCEL